MTSDHPVIASRTVTVVLAVALTIAIAACGGADGDPVVDSTAVSSATAAGAASTDDDDPTDEPAEDEVASPDELRRLLGARHLVARRDGAPVLVTSDEGQLELTDDFPTVRGRYLFDDGVVIDVTGAEVCPDFRLLGDFQVIADIEPGTGDAPSIIVEDRQALAADLGSGSATVPRWRYDCATGTTTDLDPTIEVTYRADGTQVVKTSIGELVLIETRGLGDTPVALATGSGAVLLRLDQLAYDYELSPDRRTIYATAYDSTAAAASPAAVLAIDVATGETRWRRELVGFAWTLDDRVVIEVIDPRPEAPGRSPGSEVILVDPATGEDLDRIPFTDRIVSLS
jgi:hypothetical protein